MAETDDNLQVCSQCGAPLEEGAAFCMECGTAVAAGAQTKEDEDSEKVSTTPLAGAAEDKAVGEMSSSDEAGDTDSAAGPNRPWLIIGALAALIVIVAVVLIVVFALPKEGGDVPDEAERSSYQGDAPDAASSTLDNTYSTQFGGIGNGTFPTFAFSYPEGWEIVDSSVGAGGESVEIRKDGSDVAIGFTYAVESASTGRTHPVSATKVADSDFWPFYVQGENLSGLGPFMVAKVELVTISMNGDTYEASYYAVVPASASSKDINAIATDLGCPGFDYGGYACMYCLIPDGGISGEDEETVIRILSSFSNGSTEEEYERALVAWQASPQATQGEKDTAYILPDSASRYYSGDELATMDLHDLYLARNEIYARHGRLFKNADLQAYFNGKPWYHGSIQPGDFSDGMLNDFERRNAITIQEVERSQNSPYLNP